MGTKGKAFLVLFVIVILAGAAAVYQAFFQPSAVSLLDLADKDLGGEEKVFSYAGLDEVLRSNVDQMGMVDYRSLKENSEKLDRFAAQIAQLDPAVYEDLSDEHKIAFWINVYNGITLEGIIRSYPIQPSLLKSALYPKNSIRQIAGIWGKMQFKVMGRIMTLDDVEHETLRANFKEPRIHMALVCAAMGCPPLRNEAFTGERLEEQLADQTRKFLSTGEKFQIDREKGIVHLSSIFSWFGEDFLAGFSTSEKFQNLGESERAVLHFVSQYLAPEEVSFLNKGGFAVQYLDYDWSLNEQASG